MVVADEADDLERHRSGSDAVRMIADLQRLRGPLRIAVRETEDGLGVYIPPARRFGSVLFLSLWLCGWAAGEWFALGELISSGFRAPGVFIIVWLVPWTLGGCGVLWVIGWQLFGQERLYFTAGALVREWNLFGVRRRRVVDGRTIRSVKVDGQGANDLAGFGAVKVETEGRGLRIGSGLPHYEAELVATLIRAAAAPHRSGTVEAGTDGGRQG